MEIQAQKNDQQKTEDWYRQRMGRFSCSQLHRLMTEPKSAAAKAAGELSDGAMTYVLECVAERITGHRAKEEFTSKYTDWGNDHEPIAKGIYEHLQKVEVTNSGYIEYGENFGGSPDGLVLLDGFVEFKCPFTITSHLVHMMFKGFPDLKENAKDYYWQVVGYFLITGRQWGDFASYSPNFPGIYQFKRIRGMREEIILDIQAAEQKITKATEKFNSLLKSITKHG